MELDHQIAAGARQRPGRDLGDAVDVLERHREPAVLALAHQHQRALAGGVAGRAVVARRGGGGDRDLAEQVDPAGQRTGVDDQHDPAVAEDRGAAVLGEVAEVAPQRLHDDLLGVVVVVDDQPELDAVGGDHHDQARVLRRRVADGGRQVDQRQQAPAQAEHRRVVDVLDRVAGVDAHQLAQHRLGHRVALAAALDDQRRQDRQGQRDRDAQRGALARHRRQVDLATDLLDVGAHHVHADAAPGHAGDDGGGREPRLEHQADQIGVAHPRGGVGGDDAALDRLGPDPVGADAGAVVGDLDVDLAAVVVGAQADHALGLLARGQAVAGRLDAVIDGVAQRVGERIADRLDQRAVELGLAALHLDPDLLAALAGQIADRARQLGPAGADRLHAGLHDLLLQLRADLVQPLPAGEVPRIGPGRDVLGQAVAREHQLAGQVDELIEDADVDADGRVGGRPRAARRWRGGGRGGRSELDRGDHGRALDRGGGLDRGVGGDDGRSRGRGRRVAAIVGRPRQLGREIGAGVGPFGLVTLDVAEHASHRVDQAQQQRGQGRREGQLAVAQPRQQALAHVREVLQVIEPEEPGGALDGVDGAKDRVQRRLRARVALEHDQLALHLIEVLAALRQELDQDLDV